MADIIPTPEVRRPDIHVTAIEEFSLSELDHEIAYQLTGLANVKENQTMLDVRGATETIKRYGVSQRATARHLREFRDHEDRTELIVHDSSSRVLGSAAIVSNATLREQHGSRAAWIERRFGDSRQVELAPEFNVFGWVGSTWGRLGILAAHREVYLELRNMVPDSYAVETVYAHGYVVSAMIAAGFERIGDEERYDIGGRGVPALSRFYRSQSAVPRTFEHPDGLPA